MGLIQNIKGLFRTKAVTFNQNSQSGGILDYANAIFSYISGLMIFGKYNRKEFLYKGYLDNPTVKLMTDYIKDKAIDCVLATGDIYEVDEDGNHILLKEDNKNKRALKIMNEALNSAVNMKRKEYLELAVIYKLIVGENITFLTRSQEDPLRKHEENEILSYGILPAHTVTLEGGSSVSPIKYYVSENFKSKFEPYRIYHARNANPQIDLQGEQLRGLSKIHACKKWLDIDNNRAKTKNAMLQNGGIRAIISPKFNSNMQALDVSTAKGLEDRMKEKFDTSADGSGGRVITSQEMSVQNLGSSAVDLQILEADKQSVSDWSNIFNLDATTFGSGSSGYKENVNAGSKKEITNAIIPVVNDIDEFYSHIVSSFGKTFGGKEFIFKSNPEKHFPELQEDKVKNATVANVVNGMTGNELRTLRGLLPFTEGHELFEDMETPLFSSGIVPIEDIIMGNAQPQPVKDSNSL